ncbi:MAG: DEAD/DEAH box helicase [Bacteroidaceae bacterium]
MTFKELNLIEPLQKALSAAGYSTATPIQEEAIPVLLEGRDLLGCAQTGTGKTAAFALPLLQRLVESGARGRDIKALILTPTRELAIQIDESFEAYGKFTNLRHTVIFGGVGQQPQVNAIRQGVQVLVATPGRLLDLCTQGFISLKQLEYFVLDEADRMLDMGFIHDIKRVLKLIPEKRQTLFFSATMPPEIEKLANSILTRPIKVEVTPQSTTVEKIEQSLYFVEKQDKKDLLLDLVKNPEMESVLVFTRTKHGADNIAKFLTKCGQHAEAIHGNKSQNARQRSLKGFKDHSLRILIATDIAARGIDVDHLSHVVNYELPNVPETYVHRIGRTGRAGREGVAISFCQADERPYLKDIQKLIGIRIPVIENHDYRSSEPAPTPETEKQRSQGRGRRPEQGNAERRNRPQREPRKQPREERTERTQSSATQKPRGGEQRSASRPERTNRREQTEPQTEANRSARSNKPRRTNASRRSRIEPSARSESRSERSEQSAAGPESIVSSIKKFFSRGK